MICYKDITFCPFRDCKHFGDINIDSDYCFRSLTDKVKEEAEKWWGGKDYPISIYAEKPECYASKENKGELQ